MSMASVWVNPVPLTRRTVLLGALLFSLWMGVVYWQTLASMVAIWLRSETFTHAFLILPISLWLVYERRQHLRACQPGFTPWALVSVLGFGALWLLASLVDVLVMRQLAWVGLWVSGLWALLGNAMARQLMFPLGFLFFMVPLGEGLVPLLMTFTADFTVALVRLSGIAVHREGLYFSLPSGNWSVVEACSGIRYLIASVTLGTLYAYLTYTRLYKRLLFILVSILVPLLANGLRAYMIVMLGHLSDMTIATGVDHLIYGWLFFGVVIFLLIWIGSRFRDQDDQATAARPTADLPATLTARRWWAGVVLLALLTLFWPWLYQQLNLREQARPATPLAQWQAPAGWQGAPAHWPWQPIAAGAQQLSGFYQQGERQVMMFVDFYARQHQGAELINSRNFLFDPALKNWRMVSQQTRQQPFALQETVLTGPQGEMLVWSWYRIGDRALINPYWGKLYQAWLKLSGESGASARVVLATPLITRKQLPQARQVLVAFSQQARPALAQAFARRHRAAGGSASYE